LLVSLLLLTFLVSPVLLAFLLFLSNMLLLAVLLLPAFLLLRVLLLLVSLLICCDPIGLWLYFFLLSNYRIIEYRIGEFKKLSDQGLNLSDIGLTFLRGGFSKWPTGPAGSQTWPLLENNHCPHVGEPCL
jgi:hypothetical protein